MVTFLIKYLRKVERTAVINYLLVYQSQQQNNNLKYTINTQHY